MSLTEYVRKRNFRRTPEPRGTVRQRRHGKLRFVIQKHAASRLHFDFRLELDGVLKSWAVPKGPSLDPADRRLAVEVEDHPLDYRGFEGVIPQGEYGGGTVMLWDRGTWDGGEDAATALRKGRLDFELHGDRLQGRWILVRLRQRGGDSHPNWLLIKHHDAEASEGAAADVVGRNPTSVFSGHTIDEIAANRRRRIWHSNRGAKGEEKPSARRAVLRGIDAPPAKRTSSRSVERGRGTRSPARAAVPVAALDLRSIKGARRAPLPKFVPVERATLVKNVPEGDDWLHEIKFDGYRVLARRDGKRVTLASRNQQDWTHRFASVADAVAALPAERALLDGEVVVLDAHGVSSFAALQQELSAGRDLTQVPLVERKALLEKLLAGADPAHVRLSAHQQGAGPELYALACRQVLEGVVSKRRDAPYRGGKGHDWVKTKCLDRQEMVISGFTEPSGSRQGFGALLLGYFEKRRTLVYAGRVGTGFSDEVLRDLHRKLRRIERATAPFRNPPSERNVHWVEPTLVAEVEFTEWTRDGLLRHPVFLGLREDKPATDVVRERADPRADSEETETQMETQTKSTATAPAPGRSRRRAPAPRGRALEPRGRAPERPAATTSRSDADVVAGVRLTHPGRILYPDQGRTKLEVARYYEQVAPLVLPHVTGRLLMLKRCPEGVGGGCFFQKHATESTPTGVHRVKLGEGGVTREYIAIEDLAGLVLLVQMGTLEIHGWGSRVERIENPDLLVFDLDPAPDVKWPAVVSAARELRKRLADLGLVSFVKTTGGKGLHVVVPIATKLGWDEVKAFCRNLAEAMVREAPDKYLSKASLAARKGKIFIDWLRNGRGATAVVPYSTRSSARAPIATPVDWSELARVQSDQFDLANIARRVAGGRDPWASFRSTRQTLEPAARKLTRATG